jgi:hypothetical protein
MYLDSSVLIALVAGMLACLPVSRAFADSLQRRGYLAATVCCEVAGMAAVIFLSFCSVASSTFIPFLYQQF